MPSFSKANNNAACDLLDKTCDALGLVETNIQGQAIPIIGEDTTKGQVRFASSKGPFLSNFSFVKGSDHAAITIIVYWDFLCPSCKKGLEVVNKVMALYPNEIRVVYKPFSSPLNTFGVLVHEAALSAREQGARKILGDAGPYFGSTRKNRLKTSFGFCGTNRFRYKSLFEGFGYPGV